MPMHCNQCEQTTKGVCCVKIGTCGKDPALARAQDELVAALIAAAPVVERNAENAALFEKALFATLTNVNFDSDSIRELTAEVKALAPNARPYDMVTLWGEQEDVKSLHSLLLFGLKGISAYAYHARILGYSSSEIDAFYFRALDAVRSVTDPDALLGLLMESGRINLETMALLDRANTQTYGDPEPASVTLAVEPGPFIVVTGHDLHDLALLLEATKDKGINIYTHGEMLPCHAYPALHRYPHLKGHFGTAWQNQQKELKNLPAPILFTTNCIMPPKDSYADRVFTTSVVEYPGTTHIGTDADGKKDFTPLIEKSLELGGFREARHFKGANGGDKMLTGFGHKTVLSVADKVIDAVKTGALRHIFLVGGCDGAKSGRSYYADFVKATPKDTLVLTLACGKFRFNDLDIGDIGGIPRLLDMGQCNDAYSAIKVASALAEVFQCSVNDLPLSLILSWYEQKAVAILLTLLYLGIRDIRIGPSLPAFVSPAVLNVLVEKFGVKPITTPEEDLKTILG
jgi:hydroxylamine reductase